MEQALSAQALDLLDPGPVLVLFRASRNGGEPVDEDLLLTAGQEALEGQPGTGSIWGYRLPVGQPLQMSAQVSITQYVPHALAAVELFCHEDQ